MPSADETSMFGFLAAMSVFKAAALSWIMRSSRRKEYVGKVSRLFVYPLKSARELQPKISSATVTKYGLEVDNVGDRHWLVTKNGDQITMRQVTRLTLIKTSIQGDNLRLDAPDIEPLILPVDPVLDNNNIKTVTVKNTPLPAHDCGDAAASWICKVLQMDGLRLNYSAPTLAKRPSCKVVKPWATQIQPDDQVTFQDFVSCNIMTESSMDALNKRLTNPRSVINFRPNVMVEGTVPFEEDTWQEVFIGNDVHTRFVDKCTRCVMVTIDPMTAVKDVGEQPLKELKTFRCMEPYGPKPCMGIHTAVEDVGTIKVGDPVYVIRK